MSQQQMSGRAARMRRHHARHAFGKLNLVSLMDIFTILVFFLLVNSSDVEVLPSSKDVQLPESIAEQRPRETVIVTVTDAQILVQGRPVATVEQAMASRSVIIDGLRAALADQHDRVLVKTAREEQPLREVTIMGDRHIPYRLLKRVMATCTEAEYGRISLAVVQKAPGSADSV